MQRSPPRLTLEHGSAALKLRINEQSPTRGGPQSKRIYVQGQRGHRGWPCQPCEILPRELRAGCLDHRGASTGQALAITKSWRGGEQSEEMGAGAATA
jgi:hypothetical protein